MAKCEIARDCLFFNDRMAVERQMATLFKARYCKGSNQECARYIVYAACGRSAVPSDLAPNDKLRARTMVFEHAVCGTTDADTVTKMTTR